MKNIKELTNDQLKQRIKEFNDRIDSDPNVSGRLTGDASMELDYCLDMIDDCVKELKERLCE